jgi:hypothetical protein
MINGTSYRAKKDNMCDVIAALSQSIAVETELTKSESFDLEVPIAASRL